MAAQLLGVSAFHALQFSCVKRNAVPLSEIISGESRERHKTVLPMQRVGNKKILLPSDCHNNIARIGFCHILKVVRIAARGHAADRTRQLSPPSWQRTPSGKDAANKSARMA
jgi:hypothetical protein